MKSFRIEGGQQLKGSIQPQGAKNEALQILCAVLLTPEKVTIHNIPNIIDVNKLIHLLQKLGVVVEKLSENSYTFQADSINLDYLESAEFKVDGAGLRGSIMIVGPMLSRFEKDTSPNPEGIRLGEDDWIHILKDLSSLARCLDTTKKIIFTGLNPINFKEHTCC